jgi:hypothetical protein
MLLHVEGIHDHHVGNRFRILAVGIFTNEHGNPSIFYNGDVWLEDRHSPSFVFARMMVCLKSKTMPLGFNLADCFILNSAVEK